MPHAGMNLREALAEAQRLGCTVAPILGTGEISVSHPRWPHHVKLNGRRKSAPYVLTSRLLDLIPQAPAPPPPVTVPMIVVRPLGEHGYAVMRGEDYWTGREWDRDARNALACWSRQAARGLAKRLRKEWP